MNMDRISGKFLRFKGDIKQIGGYVTDNDALMYEGSEDEYDGRIRERYGIRQENKKRQNDFRRDYDRKYSEFGGIGKIV